MSVISGLIQRHIQFSTMHVDLHEWANPCYKCQLQIQLVAWLKDIHVEKWNRLRHRLTISRRARSELSTRRGTPSLWREGANCFRRTRVSFTCDIQIFFSGNSIVEDAKWGGGGWEGIGWGVQWDWQVLSFMCLQLTYRDGKSTYRETTHRQRVKK